MDKGLKKYKHSGRPNREKPLHANEEELETAIHEAILRLRSRINEMLYLMESEMKAGIKSHGKEVKKDEKD